MNIFTTLAVQSWTLYATSISLIFSRLIFRRVTLGHFKKLQADDWIMLVLLVPYTTSIVLANQVGNAQTLMERKFRYVLVEMQIITIWLVKVCLLVLYWRIFPMETSRLKRYAMKGTSLFYAISFFIVQLSLMLFCQPTEQYWNPLSTNPQCTTYYSHTALSLALNVPSILLIMLLPVPFIPSPRRTLLAILLIIGTLVLASSIASAATILSNPTSPTYLHWMTSESSLSIIFANLPFLTSFVVTAAPARLRHLSSHLTLTQWPRSRRTSWVFSDVESNLPPYRSRTGSHVTAMTELISPTDSKHRSGTMEFESGASRAGVLGRQSVERESAQSPLLTPPPVVARPETSDSQVPKMRLSGGLAEMGMADATTTEGWPIYWK